MNEVKAVVLSLKLFEFAFCIICLALHVDGIISVENFGHDVLACGTFMGFAIYTAMGVCSEFHGIPSSILFDGIASAIAAVLFLVVSILTMESAERDFHLLYLSDAEELDHHFFLLCRRQSRYALCTAMLFAKHSLIMFDMFFIDKKRSETSNAALQPIRIRYYPYQVYKWLASRYNLSAIEAFGDRLEQIMNFPSFRRTV